MHELSIAMAIVEQASEVVQSRGGGRVHAIHVRVGPLSGVVKDALEFSWQAACEGTPIDGALLLIEDVPIVMRCSVCNAECEVSSPQDLRCAVCASPAYPWELVHGNELELTSMEIDEDDFAPATGGSAPEHSEEK
jgi:hydrogenase nickel incorporation protein HypA/HybF